MFTVQFIMMSSFIATFCILLRYTARFYVNSISTYRNNIHNRLLASEKIYDDAMIALKQCMEREQNSRLVAKNIVKNAEDISNNMAKQSSDSIARICEDKMNNAMTRLDAKEASMKQEFVNDITDAAIKAIVNEFQNLNQESSLKEFCLKSEIVNNALSELKKNTVH